MAVAKRVAVVTSIGFGLIGIAALVAAASAAVAFARIVITPPKTRPEDVRILHHTEHTITLSATMDSLTPGRYGLWFSRDTGYAKVGEILAFTADTVTRELLAVEFGALETAHAGRFSGWYFLSPSELGFRFENVEIETELGPAPAWIVPAASETEAWVINVHGRAVRRQETLRAVSVFRDAGYTSLLVSYRNDGDAPRSEDHRFGLGDTEWRDVEAAMKYALAHGARHLILMGWSMGGATVLQALTRSPLASFVDGLVLESPVLNWVTALQFQAEAYRLPRFVRAAAVELLQARWGQVVTGLSAPVDLSRLDLVARASELHVPILLLHSVDDGFVPATASQALAALRPDIVTFEQFATARHTKLWNYDSERWNGAVSAWLARLK